ncbi:MAG: DUF2948 family protein [Rhodospirillaceae bacterium]
MSGEFTPIRLRAEDAEDLRIVSACLQDAIVPITEIGYLPESRSFVMVVNRFRWEAAGAVLTRTHCAVSIQGVTEVKRRHIDLADRALLLDLLAITSGSEGLELIFAGDGVIHLSAPQWRCLIEDIGEPWPAEAAPRHETGDQSDR